MASAGLFVLMWAEFMAAALILIYGGAILVTYVFVIMLAAEAAPGEGSKMHEHFTEHDAVSREPVIASAVGFALLGILLFVIFDRSTDIRREDVSGGAAMTAAAKVAPTTAPSVATTGFHPVGGTQALGDFLFRHQLVNLELAGLILTVAMVGAIVIARKRVVGPPGGDFGAATLAGEVISTPSTPIDDNPHSIPVTGTENPRQKEYPET
jgi:NADH-quinone oxidoreductase subunit J